MDMAGLHVQDLDIRNDAGLTAIHTMDDTTMAGQRCGP
jgi:hypothetical protein